jgi:hypothetical protein
MPSVTMPPSDAPAGSKHILSAEGHLITDARVEFPAIWNGSMWESEGCSAISPEKAARCGFEYVRSA